MSIKSIFGVLLLVIPFMSQAVTLQNGDILSFTTAAGSQISGIAAGGTVFDSANLDSLNGLIIGTAQPNFPDIDQVWTTEQFLVTGNHYTSSAVTVIDGITLDFSGWVMNAGGADYDFGTTQGIATYTFDGTNFTLDYHWDAVTNNGGVAIGPLNISVYDLKLVGTVVPVPATAWLFGSGLIYLVGFARRKKA